MLQQTIETQIQLLINLGFHKTLDLSETEYRNSFIMKRTGVPLSYNERFNMQVLVDPRIPITTLTEKARLNNYLKFEELKNISVELEKPYLFRTHDSKRYSSHTAVTASNQFDENEVGCTLQGLIYFYLFYPEVFNGIAIDAIATDFRKEYHPCIIKVTSHGEIGAHWFNDLTHGINILSKMKDLITFE